MASTHPNLQHLRSSEDLVTPYAEVRAGFVALALERNRRATPTVQEARALKATAALAKTPAALLRMSGIQPALLTAAGVSDKAAGHMQAEDKKEAIKGLISKFLEPAGESFVEELVYRFLLTRGDTLGGSMRNVGGVLAQRKLIRAILGALAIKRCSYKWLPSASQAWVPMPKDDSDIELHLRGLSWKSKGTTRTLICSLTVPLVRNNVDMCLLGCSPAQCGDRSVYSDPSMYVAIGELKGGIDPAGADEHWKTARTSLDRVRHAFAERGTVPATFFVGAAIASKMAEEIWDQLTAGTLSNAANLTNPNQVASLCLWLVNL